MRKTTWRVERSRASTDHQEEMYVCTSNHCYKMRLGSLGGMYAVLWPFWDSLSSEASPTYPLLDRQAAAYLAAWHVPRRWKRSMPGSSASNKKS